MRFVWKEDKNEILKRQRNISFEEILLSIENMQIADVVEHPNKKKYAGQIYIMVEHNQYVYVVPARISNSGEECHLHTIYPSRKYTKLYLGVKQMSKTRNNYLDSEERKLIKLLETDEWKPVQNIDAWKTMLSKTVVNTLTKDQRMNIRITRNDLDGIKLKAVEEGIPYQTLVASIIHKYVTGKLVEKQPVPFGVVAETDPAYSGSSGNH